jgi:hypothetical protein
MRIFMLWWCGISTVYCGAVFGYDVTQHAWGWAATQAICTASNAFWFWWWWNRPRKRKRAGALAGAKSRARIAALVRKARQAATPRPVLRPVPEGQR